MTEMDNKLTI